MDFQDRGPAPHVFNIEDLTLKNTNFRTAVWTGTHLQITLMSIEPNTDIGVEIHSTNDQFLRIESGTAEILTGPTKDQLTPLATATDDFAILIPAGTWHNIKNIGNTPLKLYSLYGPAHHPHSTVHTTRAEADAAEAAEEHAKHH